MKRTLSLRQESGGSQIRGKHPWGKKKIMKKHTSALITLLFLLSWTWSGAEEIEVKVASDRSAVIQMTRTKPADPETYGTVNGAVDLKAGKGAIKGDMTINDPAFQGAEAGMFASMTEKTIEAIGFVDAKIQPSPGAPKKLDVKGETKTEGDQSAAKFNLDVVAPADPSIPAGNASAKLSGDANSVKSSGEFKFSGGDIKGEQVPFSFLEFSISEVENKTTIAFKMKYKKDSPIAQNMAGIPTMAGMLPGQLEQQGIKSEAVEFPAPTEEGDMMVSTGTMTLIDLRNAIRPNLQYPAMSLQRELGPDADAKAAMESMLEMKMDKVAFTVNIGATDVNGTFEGNLSNMKKFYEGYLTIVPALQKSQNRDIAREMGEAGPIFAAFMELNTQQGVKALRALMESSMTMEGDLKLEMSPQGEGENAQTSIKADGNLITKNYQDYLAKAKAAGLPVAEKAVGKIDITLENGTDLKGDMYLYTDGDLVSYYKGMLVTAAKDAAAPQEIVDGLNKLEFKSAGMKMNLQDGKVSFEGKSDTSDLSALVKTAGSMIAPQINATLTGASMSVDGAQGQPAKVDARLNFSDFFPGADEAAIKENLNLPSSAKVTMDAPAEATKLVAVEEPALALEGKLAEVQSEGQQLLAASPAEVASGSTGGGGNNWGLIALGGLLIVGVLGFLMFGKKS